MKSRFLSVWSTHSGAITSLWILLAMTLCFTSDAFAAREINYSGAEEVIYVNPGEPTQVTFPGDVAGGFKPKISSLALERQDNFLVVFAKPGLPHEGEAIIVQLDDKRTYSLRIVPSSPDNSRDGVVKVIDTRVPEEGPEGTVHEAPQVSKRTPYAPPTAVSGLMRQLILIAEFGKGRGIPGYRRSNKYTGESVLDDGSLNVKIDEIFMGTDLWAYVLSAENMLQTTQFLNPATFRIDGTRAISMQCQELAPRPVTSEQQVANAHRCKVYVITRSKRR